MKSNKNKEVSAFFSEPSLSFFDVYLGYLYTFHVNLKKSYVDAQKKDINVNKIVESLKGHVSKEAQNLTERWTDEHIFWNMTAPHAEEFKIVEDFFLNRTDIFAEHLRFSLGKIYVICSNTKNECTFQDFREIEVFLTIFPKAKEAILFFNLHINECSTDDIIFLRQCFIDDRHELRASSMGIHEFPNFTYGHYIDYKKVPLGCRETYKKFDVEKYIKSIRSAIEEKYEVNPEVKKALSKIIKTSVIEVRDISKMSIMNIDDCEKYLILNYPQQIYSILVGDEGWSFVPRRVALSRIQKKTWGTRKFVSVFTLKNSVLLFNFRNTDCYLKYMDHQKRISTHYNQEVNKYFTNLFEISGLQHGPLLNLEIASVIQCYLDNILLGLEDPKKYLSLLCDYKKERKKLPLILLFFMYKIFLQKLVI